MKNWLYIWYHLNKILDIIYADCSFCFVSFLSVFLKKLPIGQHLHIFICNSNSIIFRRHNKWCISKCATRCMATDIKHLFIRSVKKVPYEMVTYSSELEHKMGKFINIRCIVFLFGIWLLSLITSFCLYDRFFLVYLHTHRYTIRNICAY